MVRVKAPVLPPLPESADPHVANLAGRLLEMVRQGLAAEDRGGLRSSHLRLLSLVPPDGVTITELAGPLFMTKQAVGQFVTQLEGTGHLAARTDPQDRRRRVVVRTALGQRAVEEANAAVREIEQQWAETVGAERYRAFREVLEQITLT